MHFVVCRLPAGEDTSKIQAKFDNGVLEVVVPKTKAATQHETKHIQL
jgi:HSP20 family molecular chaperone IbpA